MDRKGQRHIMLFGRLHKTDQRLQGGVFMMMTTATGIGQLVDPPCLQTGHGCHDLEVMAEYATDFSVFGNSWHVTTDTIGKGMDGMRILVGISHVTGQTLSGPCTYGLKLCWG